MTPTTPSEPPPGARPAPFSLPPIAPRVPPGSPSPTNGLAIASLVLGLAAFVTCAVTAIPGVITGIMARRQIFQSRGAEKGKGLATGGLVASTIALVLVGGAVLSLMAVTLLGRSSTSRFVSVGQAVGEPGGPVSTPTTRTVTTSGAASVADKPCVAPVGPFPPGAPEVPVEVGPPPTDLVVKDLVKGDGYPIRPADTVTANYIGVACSTGKVVDSSYQHGVPATFPLDQVIDGWSKGLLGMKVGGRRVLGIPPALAYGAESPSADIAPGETLWFVIEVTATQP